jgi:uncharacterized protein
VATVGETDGASVSRPAVERPRLLPLLLRFSTLVVDALTRCRADIDALNVYPVPDGDTGTNLLLTFESAHAALSGFGDLERGYADAAAVVAAYRKGLLLGARGNSGVIMSQLVGSVLRRLVEATDLAADRSGTATAYSVADGMAAATEAAYAAVGQPVEGTVLTVARAASDEASRIASVRPDVPLEELLRAAVVAARAALARTPEQLQVLRDAGVVDAGGAGLCVVLEAARSALSGEPVPLDRWGTDRGSTAEGAPADPPRADRSTHDLAEEGPSYEVMYLLEADDRSVPALREALLPLGDSLVVVGGEGLWNVHVHVDDVGAAVEAGIAAGRPHRIRVTHFAEQRRRGAEPADTPAPTRTPPSAGSAEHAGTRRVLVLAFGPGLADVFSEAGAAVVEAAVDRRPSTGQLLDAIRATAAAEVVLVPNDRDVVPAAEAAARLARDEHGIRVAVIPTTAQVQGMAALAVHDPARPLEADLVEMTAAARHARSGAVTVAARRAITTAGLCEPGDVLGVVEGDFAVVGDDLLAVAVEVVERMLGGGGELFTIIAGADGDQLARDCARHLAEQHPTVDVLVYDGGQDRYPLLLGVE